MKKEIAAGGIPAGMWNRGTPVLDEDGSAWLVLVAEAQVQRFNARDSLLWIWRLDESAKQPIHAEFVAANARELRPTMIHSLYYLTKPQQVGSELWVLLRLPPDSSTTILAIDRGGRTRRRFMIPSARGTRAFAVDSVRRLLYLGIASDGALFRVQLPKN